MLRRTRFLGLVCGAATALTMSCSTPMNMDGGGGGDAAADVPPMAMTYTYVVDRLQIDANDSPEAAHSGFNLDNLFSGALDANGCNHEDFGSTIDIDQNMASCAWSAAAMMSGSCRGGVDNQLPTLANTIEVAIQQDIRTLINTQINENKLALIIRLAGVNGPLGPELNDPDVSVKIYLGYPTFNTDCNTVAPGREYTISASSIVAGSTDIEMARFAFTGSITAGRLSVTTGMNGTFDLPLPAVMGAQLTLPLHSTTVRANLTPAGGTEGNLGGWVSGNDVVTAVGRIAPDYITVVEGAIGGLVDIQVAGVCEVMGPPRTFGGIGLGLRLNFIPATIRMNNPIIAEQPPMTCGYSAPTDAGPPPPRDTGTGG